DALISLMNAYPDFRFSYEETMRFLTRIDDCVHPDFIKLLTNKDREFLFDIYQIAYCRGFLLWMSERFPGDPAVVSHLIDTAEELHPVSKLAGYHFALELAKQSEEFKENVPLIFHLDYLNALLDAGFDEQAIAAHDRLSDEEKTGLKAPPILQTLQPDWARKVRGFNYKFAAALILNGENERAREILQRLFPGSVNYAPGPRAITATLNRGERLWYFRRKGDFLKLAVPAGFYKGEPFDIFFGENQDYLQYFSEVEFAQSPLIHELLSEYFAGHGYEDIARHLSAEAARRFNGSAATDRDLADLPDAFHKARASYESLWNEQGGLAARPEGDNSAETDVLVDKIAANLAQPRLRAYQETPLPEELRLPVNELDVRLAEQELAIQDLNLPSGVKPVRVERNGDDVILISLSHDLDPTGEISSGGYWLHFSSDGGASWNTRIYTGLRQYFPYSVRPVSNLQIHNGDYLDVEVEIMELDEDSITFPPVNLMAKQRKAGLFLRFSLPELRRDSDSDGLTDIVEARLALDATAADTDGDGLQDDRDPMPNVPFTAPAENAEVENLYIKNIRGYEAKAHAARGYLFSDEVDNQLLMQAIRKKGLLPSQMYTVFLKGRRDEFAGISPATRVIVLHDTEYRRMRDKYGVFYPLSPGGFWLSRDGARAARSWSAGWAGGTVLFNKDDNAWSAKAVSTWVQ
ncbi:MAG: hypothetical protein MJA83_11140, partial [Gammaproteobacteria bacterium]|nr:hypothetical protein [Gammaproteobacteria bacterium]